MSQQPTPKVRPFYMNYMSQWHGGAFTAHSDPDNATSEVHTYPTAEHYMMASKARVFNDTITLKKIMSAKTPREAKRLGREVKNFNATIWNIVAKKYVTYGNLCKFSQHPNYRQQLLATGNDVLVEASPTDKIWGVGLRESDPNVLDPTKWKGTNWLGECLMKVRVTLSSNPSAVYS